MAKFVALKETVLNGKLIAAGEVVAGDKLDEVYPGLYRKASAAESLGGEAKSVTPETLEKVVAELKKQVLTDIKAEIKEAVKAEVAAVTKAKSETSKK